ncbi:hypothetical protein SDC9_198103 [bioreactor metagenome]|uniref:Uncharacterized protein n=1 Tax=bioreactor metagenome TaxID=1076179 RepID=A0A645IHK2_9ZZZZ
MLAAAVSRSGRRIKQLNFLFQGKMHQSFRILEVVFHHIFAVVFHSIGAGTFMENYFNIGIIKFAIFDSSNEIVLIHVINGFQTLNIFKLNHIGQIINYKDILTASLVQTLNYIAADKTSTTCYNNHSFPSLTSWAMRSTIPVVE